MRRHKLVWLLGGYHETEDRTLWPNQSIFDSTQVTDLAEAISFLESESVDCILVTGTGPAGDRLCVLEALRHKAPLVPIVFFDPEMTAAEAVQLVRNGADDCFGRRDDLRLIEVSLDLATRKRRALSKRSEDGECSERRWLVGESRALQDILFKIKLVGPRRCTVLITGETGTGKEMAARQVHAASPRNHLPMIAVNCSALPEQLLEAELFGHVKGAFTGAVTNRLGRFEQAHGSTLFLDEIGEMPVELQSKLLRVLQEREVQRVGSSDTIKVDVRVIAATNGDLPKKVKQGKFREDLFYRLNVFPLRMPPLRERRGDIPRLIDHFLAKICDTEGISVKHVTPELANRLCALPWPGNVRELENAVELAVTLSGDHETLRPADFGLMPEILKMALVKQPQALPIRLAEFPESMPFDEVVNVFKLSLLRNALAKTGGNQTAAAELLGLKRTTFLMKMRWLENAGLSVQAS